jgi:hypothetical protein
MASKEQRARVLCTTPQYFVEETRTTMTMPDGEVLTGTVQSVDTMAVREAAEHIAAAHGLDDWKIELCYDLESTNTNPFHPRGRCYYDTKTILLATSAMHTWQRAMNTVLHEVTHALLPADAGHGPAFDDAFDELCETYHHDRLYS